MKNLVKFEDFVKEGIEIENNSEKEELINKLSEAQDVYSRFDLESMNIEQLRSLNSDIEEDEGYHEETSELEFESRRWIQDAIKHPGSLRRKLHKKKGEKISGSEIDSELQALKARDKDKDKPGLQLNKRDRSKHRQLVLAKTLKGMK